MKNEKQEAEADEDDRSRAGFRISLPGFSAWGGPKELSQLMPLLQWIVAIIATVWGFLELIRFFR